MSNPISNTLSKKLPGAGKRVLVGLSGGVDSAVSAHLLIQQGYDVVAGFMKNYADESNPNCHTREDRNMALKVAKHLGIKTFIIFDFREEYHQAIIQYIYDGYQAGQTPNPDVLCNTLIKFKLFLEEGKKLGCEYVATGHYAQVGLDQNNENDRDIRNSSGLYSLRKGIDTTKDQTYFLSGLDQYQLSQSLFPIGGLEKSTVREIAHDIGLPNADRKDSQGLCFIGKVPMKEFLKEALPVKTGKYQSVDGATLGEHEGARFHTLGQRTGLGLSGGPWYVVDKNVETNVVTLSKDEQSDLYSSLCTVIGVHRTSGTAPPLPLETMCKIRYRQDDQVVMVTQTHTQTSPDGLLCTFKKPQRAVSPGQVVVFYDEDRVIGSGVIGTVG